MWISVLLLLYGLVVNANFARSKKKRYVPSSLALNRNKYMFAKVLGNQRVHLVNFFDTMQLFSVFSPNLNLLPRFSAETTAVCKHRFLLVFSVMVTFSFFGTMRPKELKKTMELFPGFLIF